MSHPPPLSETYRRLVDRCPALDVRLLAADEAIDPQEWVAPAQFEQRMPELIAGETTRIRERYGCAVPPHVAAARLLHHYLWSVGLLVGGPWYLTGRVPRLGGEQVWLAPRSGSIAFRPALESGSSAGAAGGDPYEVVAAHVAPVLAAFRPVAKRGARALWGMVTDDLVSALWYLGRMLDQEEAAVARAERLLPGGAGFRRLPGTAGREHLTRTRAGCCLFYAIRPAEACLTCPRTPDAERVCRLESE
ncbi:(2Fe-2S)-binding protein [Kitasatospora sp. LaBMicrA B282]|uniref:(2Fe-2S)-binding protein n=1 Tax=Kitasatospora sp. LaBMicrA B282 TaxID=3420949 RepID=UPI003D0C46DA